MKIGEICSYEFLLIAVDIMYLYGSLIEALLSTYSEETITTVVKNTRMKRHMSPRPSSMGAFRSETSTPEPPRQRRTVSRKPVPTLYVTEPEGATAKNPKWVEVEEIIEYKVNKSPKLPRRRGVSPGRRQPPDNPNANNSNNNVTEVMQMSAADMDSPSLSLIESNVLALDSTDDQPYVLVETDTESDDDATLNAPLSDNENEPSTQDYKVLPGVSQVFNLEDLEDYVPEEGETFGCSEDSQISAEKPHEVAVLQREINEPTVGQPVLLNVGRPVAAQRFHTGFFSRFKEQFYNVFDPSVSASNIGSRGEEIAPVHVVTVSNSQATFSAKSSRSQGKAEKSRRYCSEIQRETSGGQQNFKTQISANTYTLQSWPITYSSAHQEEQACKSVTTKDE